MSNTFSDRPLRSSFVCRTSRIAMTLCGAFASMIIASFVSSMLAFTFLKSYLWDISLAVWFTALSTSCLSSFDTMSNDESAIVFPLLGYVCFLLYRVLFLLVWKCVFLWITLGWGV